MLKKLSGRVHHVTTALTLRSNKRKETVSDTAYIHFKELTDSEIEYYVDNFRPFDKAGAYGIQGRGAFLVAAITGSCSNVIGLPVHDLIAVLLRHRLVRPAAAGPQTHPCP